MRVAGDRPRAALMTHGTGQGLSLHTSVRDKIKKSSAIRASQEDALPRPLVTPGAHSAAQAPEVARPPGCGAALSFLPAGLGPGLQAQPLTTIEDLEVHGGKATPAVTVRAQRGWPCSCWVAPAQDSWVCHPLPPAAQEQRTRWWKPRAACPAPET